MAVEITPEIIGQEVTDVCTYCYLFEPLRILINETTLEAEKIYIDIEIIDTTNQVNIVEYLTKYAVYDNNPGEEISVDLMAIAKQYHDANTYIYGSIGDITDPDTGWYSMVSRYKYRFKIYSDINPFFVDVLKLPIIGGRTFRNFEPTVDRYQDLTEASLFGVDLSDRWIDYPFIQQSLNDPTVSDARPTIINTNQSTGCDAFGFVVYKSRFGGWMTWGFDIQVDSQSGMYTGDLEVGMFAATEAGDPYVEIDYTGIESKYNISLKALSLLNDELKAVSGIHASPAIYYMKDNLGSLELMKRGSAATPVSSLANGGDFSLTVNSISNTNQKTK